jgi:hypothetical protein
VVLFFPCPHKPENDVFWWVLAPSLPVPLVFAIGFHVPLGIAQTCGDFAQPAAIFEHQFLD